MFNSILKRMVVLLFKSFVPNAAFLYPLKTSENHNIERVWEQIGSIIYPIALFSN